VVGSNVTALICQVLRVFRPGDFTFTVFANSTSQVLYDIFTNVKPAFSLHESAVTTTAAAANPAPATTTTTSSSLNNSAVAAAATAAANSAPATTNPLTAGLYAPGDLVRTAKISYDFQHYKLAFCHYRLKSIVSSSASYGLPLLGAAAAASAAHKDSR